MGGYERGEEHNPDSETRKLCFRVVLALLQQKHAHTLGKYSRRLGQRCALAGLRDNALVTHTAIWNGPNGRHESHGQSIVVLSLLLGLLIFHSWSNLWLISSFRARISTGALPQKLFPTTLSLV